MDVLDIDATGRRHTPPVIRQARSGEARKNVRSVHVRRNSPASVVEEMSPDSIRVVFVSMHDYRGEMEYEEWDGPELVLAVVGAAANLQRRMDGNLAAIMGISLAEYRLLAAIEGSPGGRASRADIARAVSLSPSAVTRALRPLESRGLAQTTRNARDARLALATLTAQGDELLSNATRLLNDLLPSVLERAPTIAANRLQLRAMLDELIRL